MATSTREEIRVGELAIRFLVEGKDSAGSVAVFEFDVPVGAAVAAAHSQGARDRHSRHPRPRFLPRGRSDPRRRCRRSARRRRDRRGIAPPRSHPRSLTAGPRESDETASNAVGWDDVYGEWRPGVADPSALPDLCVVEWELDRSRRDLRPHAQVRRVETFFVVEGELEATLAGTRQVAAGPGTLISVPGGVRPALGHRGHERARVLSLHTPDGGFADHVRRVAT
jgi:mannose-6-phosphate isomerase-like protein (cupin superfamily)